MAQLIEMPRLSDTMREGVLRRWLKDEGAEVHVGELLAELEVEKAIIEWESSGAGTLLKRLVVEGATVPAGWPIAIVGSPGEDISPLMAQARTPGSADAAPLPARSIDGTADLPPGTALPEDQINPLSQMRKTLARRLLQSKTTVPHFYLTAEVDADAGLAFREQVAETGRARVSMNDLVLKASAMALRKVPQANASFAGDVIAQHARVHVGLAVAVEDGLVTPVIRDADRKTLEQIGSEAHELAARARDRKLRLDEMAGGTFSVSNLGGYGIDRFAAIIDPPQAAILAVGRIRKEPVVRDGNIIVGHRMALTLSCDHRVIDGATGARLLQAIVGVLEQPLSMAS